MVPVLLLPLLVLDIARPYQTWDRYVGTIGGKYAITLDLTLQQGDTAQYAKGKYHYHKYGLPMTVTGEIVGTKINFEAYPDVGPKERFSGKMLSRDTLKGTWTKIKTDTVIVNGAKTYPEREIPPSLPFKLVRATEGFAPIRFVSYERKNDSTAKANLHKGKFESPWDTIPSRLRITAVTIDKPGNAAAVSINRQIGRAILADYTDRGLSFPKGSSDFKLALAAFDRDWADLGGAFFSEEYECEVVGNEHGVLSIRFDQYNFAGQAHPNFAHRFESYEVSTGKRIDIEDIVMKKHLKTLACVAGEPSCDAEVEVPINYKALIKNGFAITHDGLEFFPDRNGGYETEVRVPYSQIARIINPDGPLAPFLGTKLGKP